jgi:hypothetical protein
MGSLVEVMQKGVEWLVIQTEWPKLTVIRRVVVQFYMTIKAECRTE